MLEDQLAIQTILSQWKTNLTEVCSLSREHIRWEKDLWNFHKVAKQEISNTLAVTQELQKNKDITRVCQV